MGMHKPGKRARKPGANTWDALAHTYHVETFDILDPIEKDKFNKLVNNKTTWVQKDDISVHPMEKAGHIYVVVFYRKMIDGKQSAPEAKMTPRELLEGDMDNEDEVKSVDED